MRYNPGHEKALLAELRKHFAIFYSAIEHYLRAAQSKNLPMIPDYWENHRFVKDFLANSAHVEVTVGKVIRIFRELQTIETNDTRVAQIQKYIRSFIRIGKYLPKAYKRLNKSWGEGEWTHKISDRGVYSPLDPKTANRKFRHKVAWGLRFPPKQLRTRSLQGEPLEDVLRKVNDLLWRIERQPGTVSVHEINIFDPMYLFHFTKNWTTGEIKKFVERGLQCYADVKLWAKYEKNPNYSNFPQGICFYTNGYPAKKENGNSLRGIAFFLKLDWVQKHRNLMETKSETAAKRLGIHQENKDSPGWMHMSEVRVDISHIPIEAFAAIVGPTCRARDVIVFFMSKLVRTHPEKVIPIYDEHGSRVWP